MTTRAPGQLTQDTVTANLQVRALGYKPYIAPGLSSAGHQRPADAARGESRRGRWPWAARILAAACGRPGWAWNLYIRRCIRRCRRRLAPVLQALREFDYDE